MFRKFGKISENQRPEIKFQKKIRVTKIISGLGSRKSFSGEFTKHGAFRRISIFFF
jgi:hypothetical protein